MDMKPESVGDDAQRASPAGTGKGAEPEPKGPAAGAADMTVWRPEDADFWEKTGKKIAWRTLWITTFNLTLAFVAWFVVSALVVRLPNIGFKFSTSELFWLTAMPGLAGGTLRVLNTFLIPLYGTRNVVALATLSLVVPLVGWAIAVQDLTTPYWVFLVLALLAGLGGGNFSSFMPSTSLFFPKRLLGTALGLQAGIGNFGVSLVQVVTPWIIGISLLGGSQVFTKGPVTKPLWLQNATIIWVPLVLIGSAFALAWLKRVPVKANFAEQTDIFREKHTWVMTSLYIMTFGSFSGFAAVFPLLIRELYGKFEGAPDPLTYAFLGPLVGSLIRVISGPLSDRFGGAILTQVSGIGLFVGAIAVTRFTEPTSLAQFPYFVGLMLTIFFFAGIGNASTFKQMPMIFPPRQAGGVIGWTGAIAAYGPLVFSSALAAVMAKSGSPKLFFYLMAGFYLINVALNTWFYARKGAEKPC